jgi:hypothetical protein
MKETADVRVLAADFLIHQIMPLETIQSSSELDRLLCDSILEMLQESILDSALVFKLSKILYSLKTFADLSKRAKFTVLILKHSTKHGLEASKDWIDRANTCLPIFKVLSLFS